MQIIKDFVIAGVESTGKSTSASFVAQQTGAILIPEYAREYLEQYGNEYTQEDFIKITEGQQLLEDSTYSESEPDRIRIFDTDFIVIYVWSKIVYGTVDDWIVKRIKNYKNRVYFLMSPDVDWISDGLREYPDLSVRRDIHNQYIEVLESFKCTYHIITGSDHHKRQNEILKIIREIYLQQV